jgi:hypothetical protein
MRKLPVLFALAVVLNVSHSAAEVSLYSVGGLALGAKVAFRSAAYREYRCVRSEKFEGFVWCAKSSNDKEARGPFKLWFSIMHAQEGTAVYVNRYQEPAYWGPNEITDDIQRYSRKIGEEPHIVQMPARPGLPKGTLATWGKVILEPIVGDELRLLGEGKPLSKGIAIDFIGDFARSARQGLPIYRLSGEAGFVWVASYNESGRGTLRFAAVDASAYSRQTLPPAETTAPAIAAAPPTSPRSGAPVTSGLASGQSGQPTQVGPTWQTTPNVVQARAGPRSEPAAPTTTIAASSAAEEFKRILLMPRGGCINIHLFSNGLDFERARNAGVNEPRLYGKPLIDWSDDDVAATIQMYNSCVTKMHTIHVNACVNQQMANARTPNSGVMPGTPPLVLLNGCETRVSESDRGAVLFLSEKFKSGISSMVINARNLDNQRKTQQAAQIKLANAEAQRRRDQAEKEAKQRQEQLLEQTRLANIEAQKQRDQATKDAQQKHEQLLAQARRDKEAAEDARQQQQASIEFEKAQAATRLAQAEDDAHRKQEQLREQAQHDREAAEATARLAEREEPKLAEAIKEAEAARHAREAAERRLAEIRSRMEIQETARKQQADQDAAEQRQKATQEADAQAKLPINILGTAYATYVDVKRCQEAREGYLQGYISDPEMSQAKDAVLTIEQTMKSKLDQNTTTDDVWSRIATTEGRNFHPSGDYQAGTRALCRSRLALLLGMLRDQAPETSVMKKDF